MAKTLIEGTKDLIIVGGGVIGLSIAWQAASRGLAVRLFEARRLGGGASWAGAGILPPGATSGVYDPMESLRAKSHALFPEWSSKLMAETGVDIGYRRCGGFYLGLSTAEKATLFAQESWWQEHGVRYERLDEVEVLNRLPCLDRALVHESQSNVWYLPDECQVRNPRYIRALSIACQRMGVEFHEEASIEGYEETDRAVEVRTHGLIYRAHRLCITSGAWTPRVSPMLGTLLDVFPVRGQMVLLKLPKPIFTAVINEGHRYLVPRDDGHVLIGSCEEEVGYDERTTEEMLASLRAWGVRLVPQLQVAMEVKSWSGLRPGSMDGLPYLSSVTASERVFVAAGHYRHGLHFSPVTALCMVALMMGETPMLDLAPFRLRRGKSYGTSGLVS